MNLSKKTGVLVLTVAAMSAFAAPSHSDVVRRATKSYEGPAATLAGDILCEDAEANAGAGVSSVYVKFPVHSDEKFVDVRIEDDASETIYAIIQRPGRKSVDFCDRSPRVRVTPGKKIKVSLWQAATSNGASNPTLGVIKARFYDAK